MNGDDTKYSDNHIIIEEEPAHEIYARICGVQIQSSSSTIRTIDSLSSSYNHLKSSNDGIEDGSTSAIIDAEKSVNYELISEFGQAFAYASKEVPSSQTTQFQLNKSNKGFQLLTKMGYREEDGGLGKLRQGRIRPIQAKRKIDNRGVGVPGGRVKVSCSTKSTNALHQESKKSKRVNKSTSKIEQSNRQKERIARNLLRTDISIEHEEIFLTLMR